MRIVPCLIAVAGLFLSGCGPSRAVSVKDLSELRDYSFQTAVDKPQAQWNPLSYQLVARSPKGFALFDEGMDKQLFLASQVTGEAFDPCWIDHRRVVFGPEKAMITAPDGRPVPNSQGLTMVELGGAVTAVSDYGWRPRVWGTAIVAQEQDHIFTIDKEGNRREFAPGFRPEPQRNGLGIAWLDKPVIDQDYWSGDGQRRGKLIIRWERNEVTEVPNAIEPAWTADGGVVATVLRNEPKAGEPWWAGGTDLIYIAGPEAKPRLIARDARSAAPHPKQPLVAATDSTNGALILCNLAIDERVRYADHGDHPQWSADGVRLVAEEPVPGKPDIRALHVYVFKLTLPER